MPDDESLIYVVAPWATPHLLDEEGSSEITGSKTFCGLTELSVGLAPRLFPDQDLCGKCRTAHEARRRDRAESTVVSDPTAERDAGGDAGEAAETPGSAP